MAWGILFLAFVSLCPAISSAQTVRHSPAEVTESKVVSELLASQEPTQRAWGAYLAGNYQLPAFSADLLGLATGSDAWVRAAAVDSLIRMKIEIPEDVLTQMAEWALDPVLIVIARNPAPYTRLVKQLLSRQLEDPYWAALNGILAAKPPAGFAGLLLREWTVRVKVHVYDRNPVPKSGTGILGGGIGEVPIPSPPDFPPGEVYMVVENPRPGDVILANGPHPVGYRRELYPSNYSSNLNRDDYRKDYLLYLAGISGPDEIKISGALANEEIRWTGEDSYRIATAGILQKIRMSVAELKKQLVAHQVLSAAEAEQTNPSLDVHLVDVRELQVPPLPEVRWTLIPE